MLDFENIYKYFSDVFTSLSDTLYDNGEIVDKLVFKAFYDIGEYETYVKDPLDPGDVLLRISDKGKLQSSAVSIETYIQTIGLEFLCGENQLYDLNTIIQRFFSEFKAKKASFGEYTVFFNVEKTSDYRKIDVGIDKMTTTMDVLATIYKSADFSNMYQISIDDEVIYTDAISIMRETTLVADNVKRNSVKFFPNTSVFTLGISGLMTVSNPSLSALFSDCSNNAKFNQIYAIDIKRVDSSESIPGFPKQMYSKSSKFDLVHGSIMKYNAQFYEGVSL